jgi:ABC-type nitrate/sulfonate/bicarbonate transport system substrate-binding protein
MKRRSFLVGLSVIVILVAAAAGVYLMTDIGRAPLDTVSVCLTGPLDARLTGIVIAQEEGFFRKNRLAVSFAPVSGRIDPVRSVASGADTFGIASAEEIIVARSRGLPFVAVAALLQHPVEDQEGDTYTEVLFTTDKTVSESAKLVKLFLGALLRGWQEAVEHPEKAVSTLVSQDEGLDQEHELAALRALIPSLTADVNGRIGWMESTRWEALYQGLEAKGLLDDRFDPSEAYTTRFIEEIYGRDKT